MKTSLTYDNYYIIFVKDKKKNNKGKEEKEKKQNKNMEKKQGVMHLLLVLGKEH